MRQGKWLRSKFSLDIFGKPFSNSARGKDTLIFSKAAFCLCARLSGWQNMILENSEVKSF